jgi:hypothetical protein
MRKISLGIAVIAALMVGAVKPSQAQSSDGGAVLATAAGVVIGGAIVYYYYPLSLITTTALGAVVGGAIGAWWYDASEGGDIAAAPRRSGINGDAARPFRLITGREERPTLRPAVLSSELSN